MIMDVYVANAFSKITEAETRRVWYCSRPA